MTQGKISIVMPAYNEEALIYNSIMTTLEVVSDFADNIEIVAVNDGSRDNTRKEIERACMKDSRVKLVSSDKNHGKGAAIITGVTMADGEYIAFLALDLELPPGQLKVFVRKMEQS